MRRIQHEMVGKREQLLGQRAVQRARHLLDCVLAMSMEIGAAGIADQQRVAGQHQPRLIRAAAVRDQVRVVRGRMPWGGERLDLSVAKLDDLAIGERMMIELNSRSARQIRRGARAPDELAHPGDVVGLHVRVQHRDDRRALRLGDPDVCIDEVDVRLDHRQLRLGLAPKHVRGARRLVVKQLPEEHADLQDPDTDRLTNYQVIY